LTTQKNAFIIEESLTIIKNEEFYGKICKRNHKIDWRKWY